MKNYFRTYIFPLVRWGKKLVVFLCFPLIIILLIQILPSQYGETYNAAMIDKIKHAEKNVDKSRIYLCGGSDVAFGFDSAKISDQLGVECVNLGLLAGLNIDFYLNVAEINANPGDIIVVVAAYPMYSSTASYGTYYWQIIENHTDIYRYIPSEDIPLLIQSYPNYASNKIQYYLTGSKPEHENDSYTRFNFNEYGDVDFPRPYNILPAPGYLTDRNLINYNTLSDEVANNLNDFYRRCLDNDVEVVISYSSKIRESSISSDEDLDEFDRALNEKLDIPIISNIHNYMMPSEAFYDTNYHLNDKGVEQRTSYFLEDLEKYLHSKK